VTFLSFKRPQKSVAAKRNPIHVSTRGRPLLAYPNQTLQAAANRNRGRIGKFCNLDNMLVHGRGTKDNTWEDFTQFRLNPFLHAIFRENLSLNMGVYELKLQSLHCSHDFVFSTIANFEALVDLIGPMHVTQPPCKAIEVCIETLSPRYDRMRTHSNGSYKKVHVSNLEGVTCAQLLGAFEKSARRTLWHWHFSACQTKTKIWRMDEFTDAVLRIHGAPTLPFQLLKIPSGFTRGDEIYEYMFIHDTPPTERQLEWILTELVRIEDYKTVRDEEPCQYPKDPGVAGCCETLRA
jgi:hypothetical protein